MVMLFVKQIDDCFTWVEMTIISKLDNNRNIKRSSHTVRLQTEIYQKYLYTQC